MKQDTPVKTPSLDNIGKSPNIHTVSDARRFAKRRIPHLIFEFIDGGAGDQYGENLNRELITATRLQPRTLRDVRSRSVSTTIFGKITGAPFGIAPMGMCNLAWPGSDMAMARLARDYSIPLGVSTAASSPLEEIQETAEGHAWFQIYIQGAPEIAMGLVDRAAASQYDTLVFTVDVPQVSRRPRELRAGFEVPFKLGIRQLIDFATHPRWSLTTLATGKPELGNYKDNPSNYDRKMDRGLGDWNFLKRLRDHWKGNLVVKGVLSTDDALEIKKMGIDGIQVSSHGGRQFDSAIPPITALANIREAVGSDYPLLYDGGIRGGDDIAIAYAYGSNFPQVGRAFLYAAAADGERGIRTVAAMLCDETSLALSQLGITSVGEITSEMIVE